MLPGSQVGRPRPSVAGFGPEGCVRGRAESGCSFFEGIWGHWPALTESSSPLGNGEALRTRPGGALRWDGPLATWSSAIERSVHARAMPVVDASVVIDWIAPGVATTAPAVRLLDRLARRSAEIVGPRLLFEEVSNALITGVRRRRWSGAAADVSHSLLARLPIRVTDGQRDLDRAS